MAQFDEEDYDPVFDRERMHYSIEEHMRCLLEADDAWIQTIEDFLDRRESYFKRPGALARCLERCFSAALWPDSILEAIETVLRGGPNLPEQGLQDVEFVATSFCVVWNMHLLEYGVPSSEVVHLKSWRSMRALCSVIPNRFREAAFSVWRDDSNNRVLLFLICFPDFRSLLETNPLLGNFRAMLAPTSLFEDELQLSLAYHEIKQGARHVLKVVGLPPTRSMLRVLARQGRSFRYLWPESSFAPFQRRMASPEQLDRLLRASSPIAWGDLSPLLEYETLPHPNYIDIISERCVDRFNWSSATHSSPFNYAYGKFLDSAQMLTMLWRSLTHLGTITTEREMESYHDNLVASLRRRGGGLRFSDQARGYCEPFLVEPPVPPAEGMRFISNQEELIEAAFCFNNCSLSYASRIARGVCAIYVIGDLAMIGVVRMNVGGRFDRWKLDQVSGPSNGPVSKEIRSLVDEWWLAAAEASP